MSRWKKVLHAITRKVQSLPDEIKEIKNKKETNKEESITKQSFFNTDDIKCSSSTPKDLKDGNDTNDKRSEDDRVVQTK